MRERSARRPQPRHKKERNSQHDRRGRLQRRNFERKKTTHARVPTTGGRGHTSPAGFTLFVSPVPLGCVRRPQSSTTHASPNATPSMSHRHSASAPPTHCQSLPPADGHDREMGHRSPEFIHPCIALYHHAARLTVLPVGDPSRNRDGFTNRSSLNSRTSPSFSMHWPAASKISRIAPR